MSQFDLTQLLQIVRDIESGDQDKLSHIYAFLDDLEKNIENSSVLVSSLQSHLFTFNQQFIALTIIKNYKFPLEDPFSLLQLLSIDNELVMQTSAMIIAKYITEEEQLVQISQQDCMSGNCIPFLFLIQQICKNGHPFNFCIEYAITLFNECDDDIKLTVAETISNIAYYYHKKNALLTQFYREVMQNELNEDNLLLFDKLLKGSFYSLPNNELFNHLLGFFVNLTNEIPINYTPPTEPSLYSFVSKVASLIYLILCQNGFIESYDGIGEEEEEVIDLEFDEDALIRACVLHCIISEERMAYLEENLEDFVAFLEDDNDDNNSDDDDFRTLRNMCVKILNNPSYVKTAVEVCKEIMNESEIHEEAALFVLNGILPKHHMYDIDIPIPDSNVFCMGQYIKYLYYYESNCSNSTISEALESENFVLAIFAADSLSRSEYLFPEERVHLSAIIIGLIGEFESNNYGYLLYIIERLVSFCPQAFEDSVGDLMPTLFQLLCDNECVLNPELYTPICKIIEHLSDYPGFHPAILEFVSSYIVAFLSDENTINCAFMMLKLVFCKDEGIISQESISEVLPAFFQSLQTHELDYMDRKEIMEILFYAIRCGECEFPILFLTELLKTEMNSGFFIYLSSILYLLITTVDISSLTGLLHAIKNRIETSQTTVLQEAICCLFSAVSSTHPQLIEPLLNASELSIETMLNLFANFIAANSLLHPFQIKLCISCLLNYKDFQLFTGKSILEVAYQVLVEAIQFDSQSFSDQLAFSENDPFYKNSPLRHQSYKAFIQQILTNIPDFPSEMAEHLKSLT